MVCFYVGRDQKIFVSPENYGDWRSARSRSTSFAGRLGRNQKIFYLQRTMEIGDQRGRGAASFLCGNQPVCRVQLKASLGNDVAALAPSSGEDPTLPRHRAGAASRRVQLSRGLRGVDGDVRKRTRAPTDGNHLLLLLLLLKKSHHRLLTFTPLGAI